ncbi:ATP dependent DNA ligase domain-containing protein [Micromonospora echinofusca]|uniref:ATP dependent DNA ligase domain-containing protein n=1 Tax=Micromonospora echinofusca TaxID=47858 RepID=A0A1C5G725_MICEH|nr:ATP-dependent DNA ligase [Micromonospora echinofusca]SCG15507.1 ATP dependent DNA ligase domain-containing protein [Micromonospora echinofusca]
MTLRQTIEPMRAASITELPVHGGRQLAYEPKWDGWRCLASVTADQVLLQSRQGKNLTPYFPDVVRHLRANLPQGVVLDGELIIWDAALSRTSFTALQRRITAGRGLTREAAECPAHFVAFDLLADAGGGSMLDRPLVQRRARMTRLLASSPPQLSTCPQTLDIAEARRWMQEWAAAGIEGLVIKDLASCYTPGKAGWFKLKSRSTTEAIIGGVTGSATNPTSLLLGRFDAADRFRYVARTHALPAAQRRALAGLLPPLALQAAANHKHPWPHRLPAAWSAQLGDRQPLPYVRLQPVIVAEIETDAAYDLEYGRWRHPTRYVRLRADLSAHDVPPLAA